MTPTQFTERARAIVAQTPNKLQVREALAVDLMRRCLYENGFYAGLKLFEVAAEAEARRLEDEARPARNVPVGESWAFRDHRTMAQVIKDEAANA